MRKRLPYLAAALVFAVAGCEQEKAETKSQVSFAPMLGPGTYGLVGKGTF